MGNLFGESSAKETAGKIVMFVTGSVFIVATALKIHHLLTEPIISEGFWESWHFFLIQIPLELGMGIWLICGLFRKACWLAAVFCFSLFIVVTLQKSLAGAESCGCFGTVHVNPWVTLSAIDIPLLAALLIFRPRHERLLPRPWPCAKRFFAVAVPTFALMAVLMPVLIFNKPPEKTERYEVVRPEEWIMKEPSAAGETNEKQIARQWAMFEHIDIADSLRSNIAVVVFYSSECELCHSAIPLYEQMSRDMSGSDDSIRFALIEIGPWRSQDDCLVSPDTPCLTGTVDSSKQWYMKTPLVVVLRNGVVVKFWEAETPGLEQILDAVFSEG